MKDSWIGIDLDGTLAYYDGWKGEEHIGEIIPEMKRRLLRYIDDGNTVKIFTARADSPKAVQAIKKWLKDNGIPDLEVTNVKDYGMKLLCDDQCIPVLKNTGEVLI